MTITERFLRAKHWQLFLPIFGVPLVFQIVMMWTMAANFMNGTIPDPLVMFKYFSFFPVMMIFLAGIHFGWFWSVAIGLQPKVPSEVKMKTKKFNAFFFIPLIYLLFISIAIGIVFSGLPDLNESGYQPDFVLMGTVAAIIIPLHLLSMFSILYCLYFVAKTFKTVELQRETTFSDFAGEFFMIWFYPIGIWILQPKINKMVEEGSTSSEQIDIL